MTLQQYIKLWVLDAQVVATSDVNILSVVWILTRGLEIFIHGYALLKNNPHVTSTAVYNPGIGITTVKLSTHPTRAR